MANIAKKVSWSSRAEESGVAGERTPLFNGSEQPRLSRQVQLASMVGYMSLTAVPSAPVTLSHVFISHYKVTLNHVFKCCMGYECL